MHDVDHGSAPHHHEGAHPVSELEKLKKMAEHWIRHNEDHAGSYRLWAGRARQTGQEEAAVILEEIADDTALQNKKLQKIADLIDSSGK